MDLPYTTVIGLEVHVQLLTDTKLFCGCSTRFGAPPNTQTCPICIGMPGVLPRMNRKAFHLALKTAVALECDIAPFTKWDRKNYYYPDLPKNYQISQYDLPFSHDGMVDLEDEAGGARRIGIIRVHLEEDAGKMLHAEGTESQVDLNRAGTPLLEIVSMPDLTSPQEARQYLEHLRLLLRYLGVSDCNMQEGSLRCDANVNIHIHDPLTGEVIATPIVEIKNLNSFRGVERATAAVARMQYERWQADPSYTMDRRNKETHGWDDARGVSTVQRVKEEASDYRYFPEPDLVPVMVEEAWIDQVRASIGELPADRRHRFEIELELPAYDADVLVEQGKDVADYFEAVVAEGAEPKLASNWIMGEVLRTLKERKIAIGGFPVSPAHLAGLLARVKSGQLDTTTGREVLAQMIDTGKPAEAFISEAMTQISDPDALAAVCDQVIRENPKAVADFQKGKKPEAVIGFLTGQVKQKTRGRANAGMARELIKSRLEHLG